MADSFICKLSSTKANQIEKEKTVMAIIEFLIGTNSLDYLFNDIFDVFLQDQNMIKFFCSCLEPFIHKKLIK